jgi:hypothetical protein
MPRYDGKEREALRVLLEWAENMEGEAPSRIRRTEALEQARAALAAREEPRGTLTHIADMTRAALAREDTEREVPRRPDLDAAARIIRGLLYNDEERSQAEIEAEATQFLSGGVRDTERPDEGCRRALQGLMRAIVDYRDVVGRAALAGSEEPQEPSYAQIEEAARLIYEGVGPICRWKRVDEVSKVKWRSVAQVVLRAGVRAIPMPRRGDTERPDEDELVSLRACGDRLQSESSRVAAWMRTSDVEFPYEVGQAMLEVESAVRCWTEIRRKTRVRDTEQEHER